MSNEIKNALEQLRTARDALIAEVHEIDARIAERRTERDAMTTGQVSKVDFLGYVKADMDRRAARFAFQTTHAIKEERKDYGRLRRVHEDGSRLGINFTEGGALSEGGLLFYFGDVMIAKLSDTLDKMDWPAELVPIALRAERIASIDAELAELNSKRDGLANQLIEAGLAG